MKGREQMRENTLIEKRRVVVGCLGIHANRSILLQRFHRAKRGIYRSWQTIYPLFHHSRPVHMQFERNSSLWDCPLASLPPSTSFCVVHHSCWIFFFIFWHLNVCLSHSALVFLQGSFGGFHQRISNVKKHLPHVCAILTFELLPVFRPTVVQFLAIPSNFFSFVIDVSNNDFSSL